jgi:hypothetical protein
MGPSIRPAGSRIPSVNSETVTVHFALPLASEGFIVAPSFGLQRSQSARRLFFLGGQASNGLPVRFAHNRALSSSDPAFECIGLPSTLKSIILKHVPTKTLVGCGIFSAKPVPF